MESNYIDLHRNFIENQKQQIELVNKLIANVNGNEEVIRIANELIKSCEKCISIEENMKNFMHCPECKSNFHFVDTDIIDDVWATCPECGNKICILD